MKLKKQKKKKNLNTLMYLRAGKKSDQILINFSVRILSIFFS